jgi:streptomycin 6-kinase
VARDADRFARRVETVAAAAGLERLRLLKWILAGSGLSAAWFIRDRDPLAAISLRIARLAAAELDR